MHLSDGTRFVVIGGDVDEEGDGERYGNKVDGKLLTEFIFDRGKLQRLLDASCAGIE